jgi:NAD(P)-dependent dehydrogenase (short-subunit alcohol dehydrogenase family)
MAEKVWMITGASRGLGAEIAKAVLALDPGRHGGVATPP